MLVWAAGHKKPTEAQIQLVELVRFFMEVNIHQHATYFVDSLWDYTAVVRVTAIITLPTGRAPHSVCACCPGLGLCDQPAAGREGWYCADRAGRGHTHRDPVLCRVPGSGSWDSSCQDQGQGLHQLRDAVRSWQ